MTSDEIHSPEPGASFPRLVGAVGGLFFLGFGLWAMAAPESFFESVADFEPYNEHFLMDIGAFQIGLGVALLLAGVLGRVDALAAALIGAGFGSAGHTISHIVGRDQGGTPAVDIPVFATLSVLLVAAGIVRWRRS
jgi:hypothetical protein